jgi:hypothetical protein
MDERKILLSGIWVTVMLIFLLGDVIRLMSGDVTPGEMMEGVQATQWMYLAAAALMLIPILMVFFSLVLPQPVSRWANIVVAVVFFLVNAVGLPTYPSLYDKFLLAVSLVFNGLTVYYAWTWV